MTVKDIRATHREPPLPEESHFVDQAKAGDPQAFARLYDAYVERVSRYIYFRVSDVRDMEDWCHTRTAAQTGRHEVRLPEESAIIWLRSGYVIQG